ncbi:MAG: Bor family protein [Rikenellaceae bacterium]|jgi:hypothetical protein|nr:Bor family protein [Rikenellaceae bacterium]
MKKLFFAAIIAVGMASCYTLEYSVGSGAKSGQEVRGKNHYLIDGLIRVGGKTPTDLAGGATDYNVKITHTFIDGLLMGITSALYTPTTVIVTK